LTLTSGGITFLGCGRELVHVAFKSVCEGSRDYLVKAVKE
jgi:hypothetical protein